LYQNKGIGTALLDQVFEHCKADAKKTGLCLLVNQSNLRAQNFYLKNGARNQEPGIWDAPDGSTVPTFWFTWSSIND
jgi:ribosomal protein S18 acetylase RimI-like enzyme